MLRFDRLLAPTRDAGVLIEPPVAAWPALIEQNRTAFSSATARIAGRPLAELREQTRAALTGPASDNRPLIVAGHQPDFVHPGVWAKHVAVRHLVDTRGWGGLNLVVDNDSPGSNGLLVPTIGAGNLVGTAEVVLRPGHAGSAHEARPVLLPEQLAALRAQLLAAAPYRGAGTMISAYLDGLGSAGTDFVDQHLAGRAAVDGPLGAALPETRVSRAFGGPMLAHLLLDAEGFASCYNTALADYRREKVGFIFQAFNLVPTLTALENVCLPFVPYGVPRREVEAKAQAALEQVAMAGRARHLPGELSGGEQQRVAIARALVNDPMILLADEPTGELDGRTAEKVLELLRALHRDRGVTILMTSHDPRSAEQAPAVVRLEEGRVAAGGGRQGQSAVGSSRRPGGGAGAA